MSMPCSFPLLALFLLASFVVVASRSFAISGCYCNSRAICAQHTCISIIELAELAAPAPVEVATPVSVEHVETAAAAEAAEVAATVEYVEHAETAEDVEYVEHVESTESTESIKPAEIVEPAVSVEVTTPMSVEVAAPAPVEVTTPVSVEVAEPAPVEVAAPAPVEVTTPMSVEVAEHSEQAVEANTAESATTTPFTIVSMAIYRTTRTTLEKSALLRDTKSTSDIIECTLRTPSGQMHLPHTVWTSWHNIPRKASSVDPATTRPAVRSISEKLALLRDTKSPSEIVGCALCTPSGQVPPPHVVWTAWRNTQRKISSATSCVAPATHVTSDMAEKLAVSPSKFFEITLRTPSGRIPGCTVVTPGRTEAEKAAAMRAEAVRAAAVRARARQTAANSQTRRTKAHHS